MLFGNWTITEEGIAWKGKGFSRFEIPREGLNKIRQDENGANWYEWILLATEEDWLTQNDLYDLNYAFVYAIGKYGLDFDYDTFDDTLELQFEQFETEDAEEDD
ncbi:hypothetical protein V9K67_14880 [Paraflavisolibacter sp. H34]|uniref:hypothetical protein n=1 Tax=Huijunlia imazamoxiresistens TaxID=3127457 RepID=UPI00301AD695